MSGGNVSPKDKIAEFAAQVEEYSRLRGLLPTAEQATRVRNYLALEDNYYDALSSEELAKISIDVASFSARLQEEVGIQESKIHKCKYKIAQLIELKIGDYAVFKTEDKRLAATLDDPRASEYLAYQTNCECFVKRWAPYLQRLDAYSKAVSDLRYARTR